MTFFVCRRSTCYIWSDFRQAHLHILLELGTRQLLFFSLNSEIIYPIVHGKVAEPKKTEIVCSSLKFIYICRKDVKQLDTSSTASIAVLTTNGYGIMRRRLGIKIGLKQPLNSSRARHCILAKIRSKSWNSTIASKVAQIYSSPVASDGPIIMVTSVLC